jgi:hypothetical protein
MEMQYLADRYAMGVAEATERLRREVPPEDRRGLLQFKLKNATSAYDAVTSIDLLEGFLDLVTLIELQNIVWVDEGRISRYSQYPASEFLVRILERSRMEAWSLAARALTRQQLDKAREAMHEWRRQNPEEEYMSFVRFSSGTGTASSSVMSQLKSSLGGLLDPLRSTTQSVDETRDLAARALFYGKRLPTLLEWQAEATAARVAALPESRKVLGEVSSVSRSVAAWPSEGRMLIGITCAGLAALMAMAFLLLGIYKRQSLRMERKFALRVPERPPTRVHPQT